VGTTEKAIGDTGNVAGGINSGETRVGSVQPGALPRNPSFHDTRVLHKRVAGEAERELAAFRSFEIYEPGWAPTVYLDADGAGHMMRWVDDAFYKGPAKNPGSFTRWVKRGSRTEIRDHGRMSVIDGIIGNTDRHGGNAILFDGRLHPIDNGYAKGFPRVDLLTNVGQFDYSTATLAEAQQYRIFLEGAEDALKFYRTRADELVEIWQKELVTRVRAARHREELERIFKIMDKWIQDQIIEAEAAIALGP
jgi:hypothetical protein